MLTGFFWLISWYFNPIGCGLARLVGDNIRGYTRCFVASWPLKSDSVVDRGSKFAAVKTFAMTTAFMNYYITACDMYGELWRHKQCDFCYVTIIIYSKPFGTSLGISVKWLDGKGRAMFRLSKRPIVINFFFSKVSSEYKT